MEDTVTISATEFAALKARLAKIETASTEAGITIRHCNTCGELLPDDVGKCWKHPNDLTNTVGVDRFGKSVLVKQS